MQDEDVVLTEAEPASPAAPAPFDPPGTFYRVDSSRATFAELWRDVRSPLVLFVWLTKLLRVKLPGSVNDPNVESLQPFLVSESQLPPEISARLDFVLRELREEGFQAAGYLAIVDHFHGSRTYAALLTHREGQAIGRIWLRTEGTSPKSKTHFFTEFLTGFTDGTFLQSSSASAALNPPPGTRLNHNHTATPRQLWASHRRQITTEMHGRKQVVPVRDPSQLLDLVERHHAAVRDFNLARKVFAPMQESDREHAAVMAEKHRAAERGELAHPAVMAELHKLQTKRTNWRSTLIILVFSLALFIGAGFALKWEALWLLIPILFFHELGHYLAMRIFGYRNLRMFFIPFLGAAVSGENYTAPGWKKVLVALAGPLPGIVLGGVLGFVGIYYEKPMWINAGLIALALNGFNLLPVLPLDGGRVMHTILFARHHLLDVTFRVLAAGALAGLGAIAGDKILLYFGIFMLIGVPAAYRLAKIASDLRRAGLRPADLPADQVIPPEVAAPIIERVQAAFPRAMGPKMVAQHTLHVYETLATRPPGWAASIFFAAVHGGSFLLAIIIAVVLVIGQSGSLRGFAQAAASMPQTRLDPAAIVAWDAPAPGAETYVKRRTIVATFDEPEAARKALDEVKAQPPAGARAVLFGHSLLLGVPADDADARRAWVKRFDARTKQVFV